MGDPNQFMTPTSWSFDSTRMVTQYHLNPASYAATCSKHMASDISSTLRGTQVPDKIVWLTQHPLNVILRSRINSQYTPA